MFCHLFRLSVGSGISLEKEQVCFESCEYYKNGGCSIGDRPEILLSKDKVGWLLHTKLVMGDCDMFSTAGNTKYVAAISLFHPVFDVIWLMKCERLDKVANTWHTVYRIYQSGKCVEFDELNQVNNWMTKSEYDVRKIIDDDFHNMEDED